MAQKANRTILVAYLGSGEDATEGTEMTKSFPVPVEATALSMEFKMYEFESTTSLLIRLSDSHITLGSFDINVIEDDVQRFIGDIFMTSVAEGPSANLVTLIIPQSWYSSAGFL
jgi:hypothetical protein